MRRLGALPKRTVASSPPLTAAATAATTTTSGYIHDEGLNAARFGGTDDAPASPATATATSPAAGVNGVARVEATVGKRRRSVTSDYIAVGVGEGGEGGRQPPPPAPPQYTQRSENKCFPDLWLAKMTLL